MQITITPDERKTIIDLTKAKGRTIWFCEHADIAWHTLQRLRTRGNADEKQVRKVRYFLKTKEAKALIAQDKMAVSA